MNTGCVLGTGVDLVENERMQEVLQRWGSKLRDRVFLEEEQKYCESKASPYRHYAGRFAVKEAVTKAFGTGVGPHISWLDIEIVRDSLTGAPSIKLRGKAQKLACARGVKDIFISLSHTRNYAVAHALLVASHKPKVRRARGRSAEADHAQGRPAVAGNPKLTRLGRK